MPYQVLARKYRPLRFSDVAGQDHVTRTLQNALEQGRIAHGYIFSGHRGIGKTTIARILASALNCRNPIGSALRPTPEPCLQCDSCLEIRQGNAVDVIEIDAATNRGIDEIRELRDAARYRPARDKYKIYILDEAHQITDAAFNALLKTLEEPPEHIVFMLATTEPENIPQTIRSRCQHFSFHAVKLDDILAQLKKIALDENVLADAASLDLLAEAGDGSMRDALSIMDQAIASAPTVQDGGIAKPQLSAQEIRDLMGTVPNTAFEEMLEHISANQAAGVLTTANRLLDAGNSPAQIARQFVRYLRNCVVAKIANLSPDSPDTELLQISPDERRRAARSALLFTEEELTRFLQVMLRTFDDLGFRQEQRFHFELGLLKLVHLQRLLPMEHFLSQLPRPTGPLRPAGPPRPAGPAPTRDSSAPPSAQPKVGPPPPNPALTRAPHVPATGPRTEPPQTRVPHVPTLGHGIQAPAAPTSPPAQHPTPGLSSRSEAEGSAVLPEHPRNPTAPPAVEHQDSSAPPSAQPKVGPPPPDTTKIQPATIPTLSEGPGFSQAIPPFQEKWASASEAKPESVEKWVPHVPTLGHGIEPAQTPTQNPDQPPIDSYDDLAQVETAPPSPDPEATQPASTPTPATPATELQAAAVEALFAAKTHNAAAEQLEETIWTLAEKELHIQTGLSKQLMGTLFRPDVEAVIKTILRERGITGLKLVWLPGNVADKPKTPRKPRTGSVQSKALEHPTVQAAQKLFNAEITNVFDLRRD